MIGLAVVVAAFAFWAAYKTKDQRTVVTPIGVVVGIAALAFRHVSYRVAQASCRTLAVSDYGAFNHRHCYVIVSCPVAVYGSPTCTS